MSTLLFTDEAMYEHRPGRFHPEAPERLEAVLEGLATSSAVHAGSRRLATAEEIGRVHVDRYVHKILDLSGQERQLDPDTVLSAGSVGAAQLAAGLALDAVDAVYGRTPSASGALATNAFVAVRPPGHHAERETAMGFCVFNNVAIAAEHALANGAQRVLIVDWDVHHGNGTHSHFYDRRDVFFFDAHRYPFYPGSGALDEVGDGPGEGFTMNAPLPPGLDDGDYRLIFEETLVPVAHAFKPDLILVSAGFDAHRDDPLGDQRLTEEGFASLTGVVTRLARDLCGGRIIQLLEGGYNVDALARSVRACVDVLGGSTPPDPRSSGRHAEALSREMRKIAKRYFPGLV